MRLFHEEIVDSSLGILFYDVAFNGKYFEAKFAERV